jgi:hypothetical protein
MHHSEPAATRARVDTYQRFPELPFCLYLATHGAGPGALAARNLLPVNIPVEI